MFPYKKLGEFADKYGKYCPSCGQKVSRRKGGMCPYCGVDLEIYYFGRGASRHSMYVYQKGQCKEIVDHVQHMIRMTRGPDNFTFTNLDEALGMARVLLNKCGGEKDIVFKVIDTFFDPVLRKRLNIWVTVQHVGSIIQRGGCFDSALAYAIKFTGCERAEPVIQATLDLSHA